MSRRVRKKAARSIAPITVVIGYLETDTVKDALAYARGFVERRFEARSESFVSAARFNGGCLWEAQEGGAGRSFLPSVVRILEEDETARVWLPSGERTFEIIMRDGKPLGLMLPAEQGAEVRETGVPAEASGRMKPFEKRGILLFSIGCSFFAIGSAALLAASLQWTMADTGSPSQRMLNPNDVPHRQWDRAIGEARQGRYVGKLEFSKGNWNIEVAAQSEDVQPGGSEVSLDEAANGSVEADPNVETHPTPMPPREQTVRPGVPAGAQPRPQGQPVTAPPDEVTGPAATDGGARP